MSFVYLCIKVLMHDNVIFMKLHLFLSIFGRIEEGKIKRERAN